MQKTIATIIIIATFFFSCNPLKKTSPEIKLYYANWAENIATTLVIEKALEEAGYNVKTILSTPALIHKALAKAEGDIFLETWLPKTHRQWWEQYKHRIEKLHPIFPKGSSGLVVPSYVSIDSINSLNKHKKQFEQKITGISKSTGIHQLTNEAIKVYNLDFRQTINSGNLMIKKLEKAISNKKWVVITGWKPHYMWSVYDLKYLEDPKGIYPPEDAYITTRLNFKEDYPDIVFFLNNVFFDEKLLYDIMHIFREHSNEEQAAHIAYNKHKELIQTWMPQAWLQ